MDQNTKMPGLLALPVEILHQIFNHLVPRYNYPNLAPREHGQYDDLRNLCILCTGPAKRVAERLYWDNFFLGTTKIKDGYYADCPSLSALARNPVLAGNIRHFRHGRHNAPLDQTIEAFEQCAVQEFLDDTYAKPFCTFIRHMFERASKCDEEVEEHGMHLAVVLVLTLAVNVDTVTIEIMDRWPTAISKLFAFSSAEILNPKKIRESEDAKGGAQSDFRCDHHGKLRAPLGSLKSIIIPSPGDHYSYWSDLVSSTYIAPLLNFPGLQSFSTRCVKWDKMIDRSKAWELAEDWVVPMPWRDEKYADLCVREQFFLHAHETWPALKYLRLEHAESRDVDWESEGRMMWPERKWLQLEHGIEDGERVGTRPRTLRLDSILPRFPSLESLVVVPRFRGYGPHEWRTYGDALRRHGAKLRSLELRLDHLSWELYSHGTVGPLRGYLMQLTHLNTPLRRLIGDSIHPAYTVDLPELLPDTLESFCTAMRVGDWEIQELARMLKSTDDKLPNLTWIQVDALGFDSREGSRVLETLRSLSGDFKVKRVGESRFQFWRLKPQIQ